MRLALEVDDLETLRGYGLEYVNGKSGSDAVNELAQHFGMSPGRLEEIIAEAVDEHSGGPSANEPEPVSGKISYNDPRWDARWLNSHNLRSFEEMTDSQMNEFLKDKVRSKVQGDAVDIKRAVLEGTDPRATPRRGEAERDPRSHPHPNVHGLLPPMDKAEEDAIIKNAYSRRVRGVRATQAGRSADGKGWAFLEQEREKDTESDRAKAKRWEAMSPAEFEIESRKEIQAAKRRRARDPEFFIEARRDSLLPPEEE